MVIYIFSASFKRKGVYFKRKKILLLQACSLKHWVYKETEVYITACALNVGHIKELKCIINQNLTFYSFPEQMIKWKVAYYEMMKEKRGYMPHDSIQMCLSLALWIGEIGDHDLV